MTDQMPSYDRAIRRGTEDTDHPEVLPATHGLFSTPFYRRCKRALDMTPELVEHIVALHTARGGGGDGENIQATKEVPLPFSTQAWDDANELYKLATFWVGRFSRTARIPAPGPAARAWRNAAGEVVGLPPWVEPAEARDVTAVMTSWLTRHLDQVLGHRPLDVEHFGDQLRQVYRINARWPKQEPTSWSRLPCPVDQTRIGIYPPERVGDLRRYICMDGHVLTQDEYEAAVDDLVIATREAKKLVAKWRKSAPDMRNKTHADTD